MSKNNSAMDFIREIFTLIEIYNFVFCVKYITSQNNVMADALSRMDKEEFMITAAKLLLKWDKCLYYLTIICMIPCLNLLYAYFTGIEGNHIRNLDSDIMNYSCAIFADSTKN